MLKAAFLFSLAATVCIAAAMAMRLPVVIMAFDERGNVLAWCKDAECADFMDRVKVRRGEVSIVARIGPDSD